MTGDNEPTAEAKAAHRLYSRHNRRRRWRRIQHHILLIAAAPLVIGGTIAAVEVASTLYQDHVQLNAMLQQPSVSAPSPDVAASPDVWAPGTWEAGAQQYIANHQTLAVSSATPPPHRKHQSQ
jgi:hypothetical protein